MDERLQAALDGELTPDELTAPERAGRAAFSARVSALRADMGRRAPADMDAAVMRRIHELGLEPLPATAEPLLHRAARKAWAAREFRLHVRPVYGLAAAAVLAVLLVAGGAMLGRYAPGQTQGASITAAEPAAPSGAVYVQFRLEAGNATNVALAGSFSDWRPAHGMVQSVDGVWTLLLALPPGVHDYGFVVDGEQWVPDPYAPQVDDGFGGVNSRLTVLTPAANRL